MVAVTDSHIHTSKGLCRSTIIRSISNYYDLLRHQPLGPCNLSKVRQLRTSRSIACGEITGKATQFQQFSQRLIRCGRVDVENKAKLRKRCQCGPCTGNLLGDCDRIATIGGVGFD